MSNRLTAEKFNAMLSRLAEGLGLGTGKVTQVQMAKVLGIRQSSISDAKKRNSIPAEWFLKALEIGGIDPEWVRTGNGPKYRVLSDTPNGALTVTELHKRIAAESKRELSEEELMSALKRRFPAGTTIEVHFLMGCTGEAKENAE
ncbi:helix-turn-helix domain-containing protein [Desulfovibrio sp. JC010]|uniref:helix-turn-helix domain-containing protein n=1 Tax=Desulfovibrio sp. JC010 TaxID=2593641 RepID=UPI0013D36A57|nr:helix-turn-helix domain-containing protein [Desulfovibrio sp. JC010]NDV26925.1 hypothetical protein [Desulfovibrio sp. JC010]